MNSKLSKRLEADSFGPLFGFRPKPSTRILSGCRRFAASRTISIPDRGRSELKKHKDTQRDDSASAVDFQRLTIFDDLRRVTVRAIEQS